MVVVVRGSSSSGGGGSRRSGFWETKLRKLNTREERERRGKWREPFFFFFFCQKRVFPTRLDVPSIDVGIDGSLART